MRAESEAIGFRRLLTGRIDARPRWVRWLPLATLVCVASAFSSWGREYVAGVAWLAGLAILAIGLVALIPISLAVSWRAFVRRVRRKSPAPRDSDRVFAAFRWVVESLAWTALATGWLTVLLTGPTARACAMCVFAGWAFYRKTYGTVFSLSGVVVVALLIRSSFSEAANPSYIGDAVSWMIVATLIGAVLTDSLRPWFETVLRALLVLVVPVAAIVLLVIAPPGAAVLVVVATVLIARTRGFGFKRVLALASVEILVAMVGRLAADAATPHGVDQWIGWPVIGVGLTLAIFVVRIAERTLSNPGRALRRVAVACLAISAFGLAQDWDRTPPIYGRVPEIECGSIRPIEWAPSSSEKLDRHKIYDIKLAQGGRVVFFCDKFGRRVGRLDLDSGEIRWSERLELLPERLQVDESRGRVTAFLKEPLPQRPGLMAEFDLATLARIRTCPMGRWVDFAPSLEPGRFVAIQEMVGKIYEMDMETCRTQGVGIDTRLPYGLALVDAGRRYFVSGWFYSSVLSIVERYPRGELGEARSVWIGPFSLGMATDDETRALFVARPTAWAIDVIDQDTLTRRSRIPALPWIRTLAAAPEIGLVFTANFFTGQVVALRTDTGEVVATWQGPVKEARTMLWDPDRRRLFVTGRTEIVSCDLSGLIDASDVRSAE